MSASFVKRNRLVPGHSRTGGSCPGPPIRPTPPSPHPVPAVPGSPQHAPHAGACPAPPQRSRVDILNFPCTHSVNVGMNIALSTRAWGLFSRMARSREPKPRALASIPSKPRRGTRSAAADLDHVGAPAVAVLETECAPVASAALDEQPPAVVKPTVGLTLGTLQTAVAHLRKADKRAVKRAILRMGTACVSIHVTCMHACLCKCRGCAANSGSVQALPPPPQNIPRECHGKQSGPAPRLHVRLHAHEKPAQCLPPQTMLQFWFP